MASRTYGYQYETSPRKIKPEYEKTKKQDYKKKSSINNSKKTKSVKKKKEEEKKKYKKNLGKAKFGIFYKAVLLFALLFIMLFRNSQISESFSKIQGLKAEITTIQKENDQIEISIQNSLNINHIEQAAKELLGMQKLTNKQTVYINLPKKDYVEHRAEEVIIEENKGFFGNLVDKFLNIFK